MQPVLLLSTGWIQFLEVFAALSILILLHEYGHFFFARLFGIRVEKFYLFFDFLFPFPNLLNFSLLKKRKGDTVYGLGWFPLGGYVKIAGMVDESMDKDAMAAPPKPDEFRAKPAWQRLFVMLGGIIMNMLVAAAAFAIIYGVWGEEYLPTSEARYGIAVDSAAAAIGLQDGDKILSVDGKPVERFDDVVVDALIVGKGRSIEVERGGERRAVAVPAGLVLRHLEAKAGPFLDVRVPAVVSEVAEKSTADSMGLKTGDSIISLNGAPTLFVHEFDRVKKGLKGQPVTIGLVRSGAPVALRGKLSEEGIFGFTYADATKRYFNTRQIHYNPIAAVGKGFGEAGRTFVSYGKQLWFLVSSKEAKLSKSLGGLYSFGKSAPKTFEWASFLRYLALISVILAFMNLLPIPGLDGGYVFFLLWEMISGKKVSDKVMERATTVGLVLLLALMLYANGLDILRAIRD